MGRRLFLKSSYLKDDSTIRALMGGWGGREKVGLKFHKGRDL